MRRFAGLVTFVLGLILAGWLGYNLLIERLPRRKAATLCQQSVYASRSLSSATVDAGRAGMSQPAPLTAPGGLGIGRELSHANGI
jgi:hypothetical protein